MSYDVWPGALETSRTCSYSPGLGMSLTLKFVNVFTKLVNVY